MGFATDEITFANGAKSFALEVETANPINFFQAISPPQDLLAARIHAKLFRPATDQLARGGLVPAVIIVPGSLGVAVSHLAHAETLTNEGVAALVIDPFGARGVTSTVANQTQYSFAASAFDVLAALRMLAQIEGIDPGRIGAQGHSRGGAAVLNAAMRRFAGPVLPDNSLVAIYAAYPWSGQQFLEPDPGSTRIRAVIGDRDEWCLPQQVQGHVQAIRLSGGEATFRMFGGCAHSFDRETPLTRVDNASVAPGAPTIYMANDGAFIHPLTGEPDPKLTDRDLMLYGIEAGYGVRGASYGGEPGQPEAFREDMLAFWRSALG